MDTAPPTTPALAISESDIIRAYLAHHRVPCPACQYELHGTPGATCPECGVPIRLIVEPRPPRLPVRGAVAILIIQTLVLGAVALSLGRFDGGAMVGAAFLAITWLTILGSLGMAWVRDPSKGALWATRAAVWVALVETILLSLPLLFAMTM